MTVNKQNMRLWVDALRSGEFEQGTGHLAYCEITRGHLGTQETRGPVKRCCLGVATEVAMRNGVQASTGEVAGVHNVIFEYDGQRDFLPTAVIRWLGLDSGDYPESDGNPNLEIILPNGNSVTAPAAALNDGEVEYETGVDDFELVEDENGDQAKLQIKRRYLPGLTFAEIADAIERTYLGEADEESH